MFNKKKPSVSTRPAGGALAKYAALVVGLAAILLTVVVLPAEYGVDPTRLGSGLGLTERGRIKRQLAAEEEAAARADIQNDIAVAIAQAGDAAAHDSAARAGAPALAQAAVSERSDVTTITLEPDATAEIKLSMAGGAKVRFVWASAGGRVNFDTHGDRPGLKYYAYGDGLSARESGELVAAFTGHHGWFWRNRTGEPVTIRLETSGAYTEVKRGG